jgi:hypothetical protein
MGWKERKTRKTKQRKKELVNTYNTRLSEGLRGKKDLSEKSLRHIFHGMNGNYYAQNKILDHRCLYKN